LAGEHTVSVSVVVPTYNRSKRLPTLVEALAAQKGVGAFEVVFVDDASTDDTQLTLDRIAADAPFPVTAVRQASNRGPAIGRNVGWRMARAPLICFTDDDCLPTDTWLAEMVAALGSNDVVQGRTMPNPAHEANRGPFSHTLTIGWEMGYYETANMGYRREVLERVGGFDETFRYAYGEDCELAWRAIDSGATTYFADDALVYHDITQSSWRTALRNTRRREGMVQLFQRRPELRCRLGKGVFYEPTHLPALVGIGCAVALVQSPRAPARWAASAAVGLWYAKSCRRIRGRPRSRLGWLGVVPASFVVDVADIGVLAQASIRYRTLQL
jgi:GT2 family glycosyltransferase